MVLGAGQWGPAFVVRGVRIDFGKSIPELDFGVFLTIAHKSRFWGRFQYRVQIDSKSGPNRFHSKTRRTKLISGPNRFQIDSGQTAHKANIGSKSIPLPLSEKCYGVRIDSDGA